MHSYKLSLNMQAISSVLMFGALSHACNVIDGRDVLCTKKYYAIYGSLPGGALCLDIPRGVNEDI